MRSKPRGSLAYLHIPPRDTTCGLSPAQQHSSKGFAGAPRHLPFETGLRWAADAYATDLEKDVNSS